MTRTTSTRRGGVAQRALAGRWRDAIAAALLVAVAGLAPNLSPRALGADANPPPPGIPPISRRIPESLRTQFHLHVYPSYQSWLANSNGAGDCEQSFSIYLVTQGIVGPRAEVFVLLYLELVPEETA
jgi:hypothetical protein